MALELQPTPDSGGRRRWVPLAVVLLIIVVALAVFAVRRNVTAAKPEDCETKPPPNAFAVPECDDGSAPAGAKPATSGAPPAPARP
jgi:hypothetical protein